MYLSNNTVDISCENSCDIRFKSQFKGFDKPGVADVSFRCPNRICKKSITFDSLNSLNKSKKTIPNNVYLTVPKKGDHGNGLL